MCVNMADVDTVIYARASADRTGEELSVTRQLEDGRSAAQARGWTVVAELVDNNISAAGRKKRPGFEAALKAVADGRARCILAWDMSRLARSARDRLRLLEAGKEYGAVVAFCRGTDLDLSTPAGRLTADILGSVALHEIDQKSDRQKRATRQAAEQGRRTGGRRPPGYEPDGMTVRESEASVIRAGYDAVLTGVSLGRIARDWNAEGFRTPQRAWAHGCGGTCPPGTRPFGCPQRQQGEHSEWTAATVRSTLMNPRNAGLRAHVSQDQRDAGGDPRKLRLTSIVGTAAWPALVDETTFRAVVDVLTDPNRTTPARSGRALLTGVALCGVCDALVHAGGGPAKYGREPYATYRCRDSLGHLSRAAGPIDWWITELLVERLSRPDAIRLLDDGDRPDAAELRTRAKALRTRIDGLARLFAEEVLDEVGVRRESARLRAELADVENQQRDAGRVNVLGDLVLAGQQSENQQAAQEAVRQVWTKLDMDRRRAAIGAVMTVRLLPPGRGVRLGRDVESWQRNWSRIRDTISVTPHG
jgi:site-specific DNA recombinase